MYILKVTDSTNKIRIIPYKTLRDAKDAKKRMETAWEQFKNPTRSIEIVDQTPVTTYVEEETL